MITLGRAEDLSYSPPGFPLLCPTHVRIFPMLLRLTAACGGLYCSIVETLAPKQPRMNENACLLEVEVEPTEDNQWYWDYCLSKHNYCQSILVVEERW